MCTMSIFSEATNAALLASFLSFWLGVVIATYIFFKGETAVTQLVTEHNNENHSNLFDHVVAYEFKNPGELDWYDLTVQAADSYGIDVSNLSIEQISRHVSVTIHQDGEAQYSATAVNHSTNETMLILISFTDKKYQERQS